MKNSIILVTGGTGTFGAAFLERCLELQVKEIRILSRNEKKQSELVRKYGYCPQVKFFIGDICDKKIVDEAMKSVDYVVHSAAMKEIPTCELYPTEAMKINVMGSKNVLDSAIINKVRKIIFLSTDKAVAPTSMMGLTKGCMEKIALSVAREQSDTSICITRFCNLIASNGSVVPLFIKQIKNGQPVTVTDPDMSRFMMSLKEAVDLVETALREGKHGDILIKPGKLCKIGDLVEAVYDFLEIKDKHLIKVVGSRLGEKKKGFLLSEEELDKAEKIQDYIRVPLKKEKETSFIFVEPEYAKITDIVCMLKENFKQEKV